MKILIRMIVYEVTCRKRNSSYVEYKKGEVLWFETKDTNGIDMSLFIGFKI